MMQTMKRENINDCFFAEKRQSTGMKTNCDSTKEGESNSSTVNQHYSLLQDVKKDFDTSECFSSNQCLPASQIKTEICDDHVGKHCIFEEYRDSFIKENEPEQTGFTETYSVDQRYPLFQDIKKDFGDASDCFLSNQHLPASQIETDDRVQEHCTFNEQGDFFIKENELLQPGFTEPCSELETSQIVPIYVQKLGGINKAELNSNEVVNFKNRPYSCDLCGKAYTYRSRLKVHALIHTKHKPWECKECGKMFKTKADLKQHEVVHSDEQPYLCEQCGKTYRLKSRLIVHVNSSHRDEQRWVCKDCGKTFKRKAYLSDHKLIHAQKLPYWCEHCGKGFTQRRRLKTHLVIHSNQRPWECKECGKSFKTKSALTRHAVIHSNLQPYSCEQCGKAFRLKGRLTDHVKTSHRK